MARNKLSDLNNHLFAQLERLSEEGIKEKELSVEIQRTEALTKVSSEIIGVHKVALDAAKLIAHGNIRAESLPNTFGLNDVKSLESKTK